MSAVERVTAAYVAGERCRPVSAVERVTAAYAAVDAVDRPEVWITLRPAADVLAEAEAIDARTAAGEALPLAGLVAAVKDNIDVTGLPFGIMLTGPAGSDARLAEIAEPAAIRGAADIKRPVAGARGPAAA
jgi:allophanate hydrolase